MYPNKAKYYYFTAQIKIQTVLCCAIMPDNHTWLHVTTHQTAYQARGTVDPGYCLWFFNYTSAEGKGQSHKTLAYSLTMNTLLQQLQGGRGNSKQDTGKYFMRQRKAHMN